MFLVGKIKYFQGTSFFKKKSGLNKIQPIQMEVLEFDEIVIKFIWKMNSIKRKQIFLKRGRGTNTIKYESNLQYDIYNNLGPRMDTQNNRTEQIIQLYNNLTNDERSSTNQ